MTDDGRLPSHLAGAVKVRLGSAPPATAVHAPAPRCAYAAGANAAPPVTRNDARRLRELVAHLEDRRDLYARRAEVNARLYYGLTISCILIMLLVSILAAVWPAGEHELLRTCLLFGLSALATMLVAALSLFKFQSNMDGFGRSVRQIEGLMSRCSFAAEYDVDGSVTREAAQQLITEVNQQLVQIQSFTPCVSAKGREQRGRLLVLEDAASFRPALPRLERPSVEAPPPDAFHSAALAEPGRPASVPVLPDAIGTARVGARLQYHLPAPEPRPVVAGASVAAARGAAGALPSASHSSAGSATAPRAWRGHRVGEEAATVAMRRASPTLPPLPEPRLSPLREWQQIKLQEQFSRYGGSTAGRMTRGSPGEMCGTSSVGFGPLPVATPSPAPGAAEVLAAAMAARTPAAPQEPVCDQQPGARSAPPLWTAAAP